MNKHSVSVAGLVPGNASLFTPRYRGEHFLVIALQNAAWWQALHHADHSCFSAQPIRREA